MNNLNIYNSTLENWSEEYNGKKHHAVICDPPYFLNFMNNKWDEGKNSKLSIEKSKVWGESIKKHVYPGAIVMMFSSPRTSHYLTLGMEEAGFYLWDTVHMLFGTGYPKSQSIKSLSEKSDINLSEEWNNYKTRGLKGAYEPLLCFVAPDDNNSYVELAYKYGTGSLNIEAVRLPIKENVSKGIQHQQAGTAGMNAIGSSGYKVGHKSPLYNMAGRFPSNLILDEVVATDIDNHVMEENGVSRYFYTTKVQKHERDIGLEFVENTGVRKNKHPTLKSIEVIKYFSSMILPPKSVGERRILIPFAGVFSEVIGAKLAGWDYITAIEQENDYIETGNTRYHWWLNKAKELNTNDVETILENGKVNQPLDKEISWMNI